MSNLAEPSDKLVAISGVAKYFTGKLEDVYFAGLWKRTFVDELAWQVAVPVGGTRPKVYRTPSWSWASIDATIMASPWQDVEILCQLLDAEIDLVDPGNATGAVRGGRAILKGMLTEIREQQEIGDMGSRKVHLPSTHNHEMPEALEKTSIRNDVLEELPEVLYFVPIGLALDEFLQGIVLAEVGGLSGSVESERQFRMVGNLWAKDEDVASM
ncbi:Fc.00g023280.m01.CDS01 [Cosmosporella sp. VM-42]